jgi:hypothetical protein
MSGSGYVPPAFPEPPEETKSFGRLLFQVAQDHLDPDHDRLEWSEGFTGNYGPDDLPGPREYGRKFGWAQPGDPGQAMVYVAVGDIPQPDRLPCGTYNNPEPAMCHVMPMANGSSATVLSTTSRRELHWSRPDGSYVFAIVDSTFRNNTLVPSTAALPTLEELEGLVTDPRLVLPPRG